MRITQSGLLRTSLQLIEKNMNQLMGYQQQLASHSRINQPSDDPVATYKVLNLTTQKEKISQYQKNSQIAQLWLNTTDSVLSTLNDFVQKAQEIAVSSNELLSQEITQGLANQINEILETAVDLANTSVQGAYIFAGNKTDRPPFVTDVQQSQIQSVSYQGDAGQRNIEISEGNLLTVNLIGSNETNLDFPAVFKDLNLGVDLFDSLIGLRNALQNRDFDTINTQSIPNLAQLLNNLNIHQGIVGLGSKTITEIGDILTNQDVDLASAIAAEKDIDLASVISKLNYQQTVYQANLYSTAKLVQPNLFDFIR